MKDVEYPAMTINDFARRWGVSWRTAKNWIAPFESEIGERVGNVYSPHQVAIILSKLE